MNLGKALLFLFAFAKLADAKGTTRNLATSRSKSTWYTNSWNEQLQQCRGAVCGMWGDPHMLTCDGVGYDCNAYGLFTLMKNFLYNIQAHFVHVGTIEMNRVINWWDNFPRATYATSLVIENMQDPEVPIFQFSFPEYVPKDGPVSEHGCYPDYVMSKTLEGHSAKAVGSVKQCQQYCEETDGCANFHYCYGSGNCYVAPADAHIVAKPEKWTSRTVAGAVDTCGIDYASRGGKVHEYALWYGNDIKYGEEGICPLLFYVNGDLMDISKLSTPKNGNGDFLYGDASSDVYVQLYKRNRIKVVTKTDADNLSEIMIEVGGQGLGELFGCHFNMFVCLPKEEKTDFYSSVGLMGSPDSDRSNDWMTQDGTALTLASKNGRRGAAAFEYCTENWCVPQEESNFIPPEGATYDDVACVHEEYIGIDDEKCLASPAEMEAKCSHHPALIAHQCKLECCMYGNCDIQKQVDEITEFKPLSERDEDIIYDTDEPEVRPICVDGDYTKTSDAVCPDAGDVVEVLSGEGAAPVIYGIDFIIPHDDAHGSEVSFYVGNPLSDSTKTYVRYEKKVGQYANDPACDKQIGVEPGCVETNNKITVGCIEYPGVAPFALVDVYFASSALSGGPAVQECCHPDEDGLGVVKYSLKIQCGCPIIA